mgnify:CR=1 FL=1
MRTYSPLTLAYIGDGIYDLIIRTLVIHQGDKQVQKLHLETSALVNAGYMVLNPEIFNYIEGDKTIFEKSTLQRIAEDGQLMSYRHKGFWQCMDTKREQDILEHMWESGSAPWKIW